jgi:hypothetical protein
MLDDLVQHTRTLTHIVSWGHRRVDLSPKMVEESRAKGAHDRSIVDWLIGAILMTQCGI